MTDHTNNLHEYMAVYGGDVASLKFVGGFMSDVYEFQRRNDKLILKVIDKKRRSKHEVAAEAEWLRYLSAGGLSVAPPVLSLSGQYVEDVDNKLLIAYAKADGHEPNAEDWDEPLFYAWGKFMGHMHRLTKDFLPSAPEVTRGDFVTGELHQLTKEYASSPPEIKQWADELISKFSALPKDSSGYGLVHSDLHSGNFHVANGQITAFDFDDIAYSWFANDAAIALYYSIILPPIPPSNRTLFASQFLEAFLRGYETELHFQREWLGWIQDFVDFAHIHVYWIIRQKWDLNHLTARQAKFRAKQMDELMHHRSVVKLQLGS